MQIPGAERLSHAYIISGPDEDARLEAARRLAAAAVCSGSGKRPCGVCRDCRKAASGIHPDIITVDREPDKRNITVGQARALRTDALVMPNEAVRKVYVILHADSMNEQAQNALLKTLEEPPSFAVFLLLAENEGTLLETVRSRCVELPVTPSGAAAEQDDDAAKFVKAAISGDREALLACAFAMERQDRFALAQTLVDIKRAASTHLRGAEAGRAAAIIETAGEAEKYLSVNVSVGHISGLLLSRLL